MVIMRRCRSDIPLLSLLMTALLQLGLSLQFRPPAAALPRKLRPSSAFPATAASSSRGRHVAIDFGSDKYVTNRPRTAALFLLCRQHRQHQSRGCSALAASAAVPLSAGAILPLIKADDSWGNYAALLGTAAASQVLGTRTVVGRLLGPPVSAMALTFFLASIGVLAPGGTAAAKSLQLLALQIATPLILLGADLDDAVSRCGPLLVSFAAASAATLVACLLGWKLAGGLLVEALGPHDGLVLAAALMAKNIGGGINYIAVCQSLQASPLAVAAGLCVGTCRWRLSC